MHTVDLITTPPARLSTISVAICVITLFCFSGPRAAAAVDCGGFPTSGPNACGIYNSWNSDGTLNNPPIYPTFTTSVAWYLLIIGDYHWNSGQGQDPAPVNGWIGIYDLGTNNFVVKDPAIGFVNGFNTPNTVWETFPNVWLPPGAYEIVDSDPSTWSYTVTDYYDGAGRDWEPYKGFSWVIASPTGVIAPPTPEPGTLTMLGSGILGLAGLIHRKLIL